MRAVVADLSTPRYLFTAVATKANPNAGWGPGGLLSLQDSMPVPGLPQAPGWLRLRPELSGICGSDLSVAHAKSSFVLSAYYRASKQILGHEIVAVVDEVGPGVAHLSPGDRVVIDPVISCVQRGFYPVCGTCAAGLPYACERFDQPGVAGCQAPTLGFDATVGGGWGQFVVAHESQCYPVGDLASTRAVLAEPASIGLHTALRWPRTGDRVVVIGPGTIGLLVTAALRRLHPDLDIAVVSPGEFGAQKALEVGATRTLPAGADAVEVLAAADGGRVIRPRMTKTPILEQGVDAVFDCVGLSETIDLATHLLRPGGTLVLAGGAGKQTMDWSLVWNRQLAILGTINFGPEPQLSGRHTMSQIVEWLRDPQYPVGGIVTESLDLSEWKDGLALASAGPRSEQVKVALRPNLDVPLVG